MKAFSFLALLLCVLLAACNGQNAAQNQTLVGIVDLEQILRESDPAIAARKHVAAVRDVLKKGVSDLEKEWKDAPQAERNQALAEGATALQRQLLKEEQAANQVVLTLLKDECEKWRASHKALFVTTKQELLAADTGVDITAHIIAALNKRVPVFAALPTVSVNKREKAKAK
ncbi:MAG: OmpH family outer membrane protein [Desulfovibrio sp.]|nr:OmpH family outer membrane protein [Desulfovibrio sp.]